MMSPEGLVAEHGPHGPTETHLVEETGILWRKRRLRLAEAAAHGGGSMERWHPTARRVKVALVHLDTVGQSERMPGRVLPSKDCMRESEAAR
jgi:hypothetical protein